MIETELTNMIEGPTSNKRVVLVTGATGYIGGRLVSRLLTAGYTVRCLVRTPRKLESRSWYNHPRLTVIAGDAGDKVSVQSALEGCWAAYYLIHSMIVA
ncbi:NmrA family NAD(P)-binding protein, partial [Planctomycetota bacterium]